jgi:hypothetical protein
MCSTTVLPLLARKIIILLVRELNCETFYGRNETANCCLYCKNIMIQNNTYSVVRMTIVSDTTTCNGTYTRQLCS